MIILESLKCPSNAQLDLIDTAVVRLTVQNILRKQFDNIWDIFNKINLRHGQLIDRIVQHVLGVCTVDHVDNILEFMNYTSNVKWKRIGYQAIFNEFNSNSNLSSVAANWLAIQHFVSHDKLTAVDLELTELLNQIESITNVLLESPAFDIVPQVGFDNQICIYDIYSTRKIYLEYAIERMSSSNPSYIPTLWKSISTKSFQVKTKDLSHFIATLEQNSRSNYIVMTIPYIRKNMMHECAFLKRFSNILSRETILGSLLVSNQHFYIQSAFDGRYLCYLAEPSSNNKNNRPTLCSNKNSTWRISPAEVDYHNSLKFLIEQNNGELISLKKCELRNEWYTSFCRYCRYSQQSQWDFEVDDINRFVVRAKSVESGQYLRIGSEDELAFSALDAQESSKFEWIFKSVPDNDDSYAHRCN